MENVPSGSVVLAAVKGDARGMSKKVQGFFAKIGSKAVV